MNAKLTSGQVIQRRYTVVRLLGEGGFGAVYLVQDTRLGGKAMALKESFDNSAEAQQQFQLEANLLASLSHPNLPRVSDYFIEITGCQYLVMDFIEGQDLTDMIVNRRAPLPENQALKWMIEVCQAVATLHSQRPNPIIHRDIKPSNIKITPAGQAVLVDFGIAKVYIPKKGTARIAKAFTPGFSPPEQYVGTTDTRSDVYALGATLYAMLTATVPPDAMDRLTKGAVVTRPSRLNPKVSAQVEQVTLQAMEMDNRKRFASAQELLQALQACLAGQPVITPAVPASPASPASSVCPLCGTVNRPGARFCQRDGTRLGAPAAGASPVSPPASPAGSYSPEMNFELGNAHARSDQHDLAIQAYRQALAGGFTDPALYYNLGLVYILASRAGEAIPVLQQGLANYRQDADLTRLLARAYAAAGQMREGQKMAELAVRLAPQDYEAQLVLGMILLELRQHKLAIAPLEQAVRLKRDQAAAHYYLGRAFLLSDQFDRAEKCFVEGGRLAPRDADYPFNLGLAQSGKKKFAQAIQAFNQALKLDPRHYLAHYFMGQAYAQQDNWSEASKWYQKAALLDPSDPDPHIDLAVCYAMLKRRNEAMASLLRALSLDPNNQRARELLNKL